MPEIASLLARVENAASLLPPYWPLRSFIAANPLQGLENLPFEEAVAEGRRRFGGRAYPIMAMARKALAEEKIDTAILREVAMRHGRIGLLERLRDGDASAADTGVTAEPAPSAANRVLLKWLAAFLDEGQAAWPMPHRELGFYRAWRRLAAHDPEIPGRERLAGRPDDAARALLELTSSLSDAESEEMFARHLGALPGWSSYVKWRQAERNHPWRTAAPITLADLLAVRMTLADLMGEPAPVPVASPADDAADGAAVLEAWEETYRRRLTAYLAVQAGKAGTPAGEARTVPNAQLVFCIDVRSEVFRRNLERLGPYETLGFAGFFGIPLAVKTFGEEHPIASCPVLLEPKHLVDEHAHADHAHLAARHLHGRARLAGMKGLLRSLKESVAGAFAFVEASGLAFGAVMAGRTLAPAGFGRAMARAAGWLRPPVTVTPRVELHHHHDQCHRDHGAGHGHDAGNDPIGLSPAEHAFYAEAALRIMGLTENFAPLVVLTGHGGATVNNPFAAGLDCGACGGNRGGPNARIVAAILNLPGTRRALAERGIFVPAETLFVAAEHNTTTDEVVFFDPAEPAKRHPALFAELQTALATARAMTAGERASCFGTRAWNPVSHVETRAADWAQVRPEWALARNAAFIVAHRDLTRDINLQGRTFLHSYDWRADTAGKALEVILTAPMVVAEWINTQYYFSTIDNVAYGAGSKVTHNVVGAFGVMQGNASDLMTGLPLQSVNAADGVAYHEPLRLMTVVQAPVSRVDDIIARNPILQTLFGNGWVALQVMDPTTGAILRRGRNGSWQPAIGLDGVPFEPAGQSTPAPEARESASNLLPA